MIREAILVAAIWLATGFLAGLAWARLVKGGKGAS